MTTDAPLTVTRLTGPGVAALATVRVEGSAALEAVESRFRSHRGTSLAACPAEVFVVGVWRAGDDAAGEEVVVARRGDHVIEIHSHGGESAVQAILASLATAGARIEAWPAWAARSEGNAIAAEARIALAQVTTQEAATRLLVQYHGALQRELESIVRQLESGQTAPARQQLEQLRSTARWGLHLVEPFQIALVGPANAGKSSLLNALVGYERAIVFDQPGTTRDVLSASSAIAGWPVQFSDTAGLRTTSEVIEQAGIELTRQAASRADLILVCLAKDQPDEDWLREIPGASTVRVGTKSDLPGESPHRVDIETSARGALGIETLIAAIEHSLLGEAPQASAALLFTRRQLAAIDSALQALLAGNASGAIEKLRGIGRAADSSELA